MTGGDAYAELVAHMRTLSEHSAVLNYVGFRMAEALGDVGPEDDAIECDPSEQVNRLIERAAYAEAQIAAALDYLQDHLFDTGPEMRAELRAILRSES